MDRSKKLMLNTISPLVMQVVSLICGFILPRLILKQYGSEVNGLVNSITQFLSAVSFLELGVGAVVQSSLYKPLAERNKDEASRILASGGKFFRKIAYVLTVYVVVLIIGYPFWIHSDFGWSYIALLIGAISIGSFAQYYFGILDGILLNAAQMGYIQYSVQIISLILNVFVSVILIKCNASIQLLKLVSSLVFLIKPIIVRIFIVRNFDINRKIKYETEPIKQKWNGIAQHVAHVVLESTDTIVLSLLSTLSNVSVYSVYSMIVVGIKRTIINAASGVQALFGDMIAKSENEKLNNFFSVVEFALHTGVTYIFTCTAMLIVPFVEIYTKDIDNAEYIQPLFAYFIVAANACHCLRLPYNLIILAGGHYKQTQSNYIIAAILNIVISVATVYYLGLVGVAIGTLVAMAYQTIWMAVYTSKNIIGWPFGKFVKQCVVDLINATLIVFATHHMELKSLSFLSFAMLAVNVAIVAGVITVIVSFIFYRRLVIKMLKNLKKKRFNKKA